MTRAIAATTLLSSVLIPAVANAQAHQSEPAEDSPRVIGLGFAETGDSGAARERWERARSLATAAGGGAAVFDHE